jgi:hypothetical protein
VGCPILSVFWREGFNAIAAHERRHLWQAWNARRLAETGQLSST